ncbi:MAG TPA: NADH-quinone oxidoreductase subunit NuoH [Porphyromonadaceae bacterium]|jgi:NADH-quinone oxidoreductase subunit H|uniref:NADH-quinone oxidoreductase subunit NuoH n=1 Tax=Limibacterium fermenti TaxID=3229863 RepID=UPI000E7E02F7|nr:NADH-quinone oxidoreductase subunit NuoH [Porphyromonadaceae bacterium]HBK31226.1 NADH-quinone oxidoreductase subunit NuoH [Porphyromonadaceae bacterium]HBL33575.1 NADH-quinone oxidoreductase subunit NuoH [Porphyromonadaceae bacterium]HBX20109.1 NADH-quinone oxidoreductase subunit NuoH [Porphyromonadaceae bacterium]HBX45719.1 NADH-quinone oxidoreductase subunit NuoH [Porphyromonadaceae bacterium]
MLLYSQPLELTKLVHSLDAFFRSSLSPFWATLVEGILIGIAILAAYALIALALIYIERKIAAFFQSRLGPNRLGKYGVIQSIADMIKILIKEIIHVNKIDKLLYYLAPFFVIVASVLSFGAIPFGQSLQAVDFNIGVFYVLAVSSIGVIGILLAGWSSNNKYSMIGAMRSGAQFISYELSAGFSLMTIVVLSGTMQFSELIEGQRYCWNLFNGHIPAFIAFVIFLISGHAETNRGPFDLPEAESELTAGYHTEYSGLRFGFFYLAEYLNMFIIAAIATTVFLGGWMPIQIKGWDAFNQVMWYIPSWIWFFGKAFVLMFLSLWVRWSFPRLRIDLLLNLEWKYLLPINLVNILVMVIIVLSGLTLADIFPAVFGK